MAGIHKTTLSNGVRVLCEPLDYVGSASVGLWCTTGSANENDDEGGITHFIEHMLFKGTEKRTAKQIVDEIEGHGGMLNAFTDKENTCYYCRVLSGEVTSAIDVLCDMMTSSRLDPKDLEVERQVILEEIKRGEDEPSDHVHDLHVQYRWPKHVLGRPVIGTPESVSSFRSENLRGYMDRRYLGGHFVLAVAGNADPAQVVDAAVKGLGHVPNGSVKNDFGRPADAVSRNEVNKDVEQIHFCIGTEGCSYYDDDRYTAMVLDGVLGEGMGSRLFQEVREKRGLAYSIGSYELRYSSGGSFIIYGGTSPSTWEQMQDVVRKELDKVMGDGAEPEELARVKRAISGTLVINLESMSARMIRSSRNEIVYGRDVPVEEVLQKLDAVTNEQLVELARRVLVPEKFSTTAIGPFDA